MSRIALLAAGLVATLALAAPLGATNSATKLTGTTGPGFTITLKKAGKYTITVMDKSNIHNFRIKGPGLNKQITTLSFKGSKTATVTLKKGTYTYQCDPHASQGMKHTFRVT